MELLKFLAAPITIAVFTAILIYLPLWVYFGMNSLYLISFYRKNNTFVTLGFFIIALLLSAPLYSYDIVENLIDGKKWNDGT